MRVQCGKSRHNKLNVGRQEGNVDGTEQTMQEKIQVGTAGFVQHFFPVSKQGFGGWKIDTPSSQREQIWGQGISRIEAHLSAQVQEKHEVPPPGHIVLFCLRIQCSKDICDGAQQPPCNTRGGSGLFGMPISCFTATVGFSEAHSRRPHLRHTKHCSNRIWRQGLVDYRSQGNQHNGRYTPTSIFARNLAESHQASVFW